MYKNNIHMLLRNLCYRGQAISITNSGCICSLIYPARTAHAPYCHFCLLWLYYFLSHPINDCRKKVIGHKNGCFFLQLLFEIFLIRSIRRDIIINIHTFHVNYPFRITSFPLYICFALSDN